MSGMDQNSAKISDGDDFEEDNGDNDVQANKEEENNDGPTGQESMPFSPRQNPEKTDSEVLDSSSLSAEDPVTSLHQVLPQSDTAIAALSTSAPAINIHGSNNVVVFVPGSANKLDIREALAAGPSRNVQEDVQGSTNKMGIQKALSVGPSRNIQEDEDHQQDMAGLGGLEETDDGSLTLQTKIATSGIQLGEDLRNITQDFTPTPDSAPVTPPFDSQQMAYSHVSTIYSPTHTTDSNLSESDARLEAIDEDDVPSPKSTDDWMSSASERSTLASSGERCYSPTTPVQSDWMSGPSSPDSENPPDSPGEAETPWEIMVRGEQAQEAYLRACRFGTKKVYRTRLMLVGQERVGKTSLMKSLLGQEHDTKEEITDGVNTTIMCKVPIKDCTLPWEIQHSGKKDRVQHVNAEYNKAVASSMADNLMEMSQDEDEFNKSLQKSQEVESDVMLGSPTDPMEEEDDTDHENNQTANTRMDQLSQSPSKVMVPEEITEGALQKLNQQSSLDDVTDQPKPSHMDCMIGLQFWDFAGQLVYYTTHQVFLNRRAIFVLVYDASQDLKLPSAPEAGFEHEEIKSRYHDFTGLDFIHFWLQSVYAYAVRSQQGSKDVKQPHKSPPVFIVGTHRDSLQQHEPEGSLAKDRQHQLIYEAVEGKPYEEHVLRRFHMVENSLKNKMNPQLVDLRRHIAEVALEESYMGEKIPVRWLQFEKAMIEAVAENTTHMHIRKVRDLARRFKVRHTREFSTMLQFYHDLGCIVYFGSDDRGKHNQALRDVVVLDPQWLIDVFKRIITVKPDCRQWSTFSHHWRKLREEGILEEELIDHVWEDLKGLKPTFISLMEMFDLLCPQYITTKDTTSAKDSNTESAKETTTQSAKRFYYVPACLQPSCQKETNYSTEEECDEDTIFYVDFEEFLPDGLFHRVLVHIARWSQEECNIPPKLHYRCGKFYVGTQKNRHIVELHMRPTNPACIKVIIRRPVVVSKHRKRSAHCQACPQVCSQVQGKLDSVLNIMKKTWMRGIVYHFRVPCEACNDTTSVTQAGDNSSLHLLDYYEVTHEEIDSVFCPKMECEVDTWIYKKRFKCLEKNDQSSTQTIPSCESGDFPDSKSEQTETTTHQIRPKNGNDNKTQNNELISDTKLSILAGKMGAEWKAFGIEQLDMTKENIDQCILNDPCGLVRDHIFAMLHKWKMRSGLGGTFSVLIEKLQTFGVSKECYEHLSMCGLAVKGQDS